MTELELEELKGLMCDYYCKWPTSKLNLDEFDEKCYECPLDKLGNTEARQEEQNGKE